MTLLCTNTKFIKETVNPLPSYYNKNKYNKSKSLIMYLTASDEKNCTTVNKERNSSKLTTQVILVLYQSKKRKSRKIGSNDASDANDAGFMGVKLFVTCVICVILKFFKKLIKKC